MRNKPLIFLVTIFIGVLADFGIQTFKTAGNLIGTNAANLLNIVLSGILHNSYKK